MREIDEYHKSRQQENPVEDSSEEERPASEYYCDLCEKGFKTTNQL